MWGQPPTRGSRPALQLLTDINYWQLLLLVVL